MEKLIVGIFITIYLILVLSLLVLDKPLKFKKQKSCMTCKFDNEYLQDTPCLYCKNHNKWRPKEKGND